MALIFYGISFFCQFAKKNNTYQRPKDNIPQLVQPINIPFPPIKFDWIEPIQIDELRDLKRREAVIIVDAGTPGEYRRGHIPDAILYSAKSEDKIIGEYNKSGKTVVVYNHDSEKDTDNEVARKLYSQGVADIKTLFGGYDMWRLLR